MQFRNNLGQGLVLMPVILATQEAEIRRIAVLSQSLANSSIRPYLKKLFTKIGLAK
jgi:hypothetical protein